MVAGCRLSRSARIKAPDGSMADGSMLIAALPSPIDPATYFLLVLP